MRGAESRPAGFTEVGIDHRIGTGDPDRYLERPALQADARTRTPPRSEPANAP